MIPSPVCTLCNIGPKNTIHHFWDCPSHVMMWNHMVNRIMAELGIQADRENRLSVCLQGNVEKDKHVKLFSIITDFIKNTTRFK
jgi:hypothetical protein